MKKISINRKEGSLLPLGVGLDLQNTTTKIKTIKQDTPDILEKIINNITYKLRMDINEFCKDRFEANMLRVIKLYKGTFTRKVIDGLDVIVDEQGKLFNHKFAYVYININPTEEILKRIQLFRNNHPNDKFNKLYLVTSKQANYNWQPYEMNRSYEWFEGKFKSKIALWETARQNVDLTPDLYKRQWIMGKKELKRQHKKFFQPQGQSIKIGLKWHKQPFKGRPYFEKQFIDSFKIYDSETKEIIFEHTNWGSIVQKVRQYIKDNAYEYYQTNRYAICAGYIQKQDLWIDIVKYDTLTNEYTKIFKQKK